MALPGILKKPIKAYQAHQNNLKIKREALTNADSLVSALKFLKPGCDLNLKSSGLGSGKRSWVEKYLHPHGGKAGAADGLRTFAELHEKFDTHPIAKQAAKNLAECLPKKNSDNQTVKYDEKLYELAKRIANPKQYEHELKVDTPAPTVVAVEPIVNQASDTSTIDAEDLDLMDAIDNAISVLDAPTAFAIQKTNSEVSDSLLDGGRLRFAPTLLGNLPKPPGETADQDLSDLDKLNHYLDNTNLLNQVGEGERHGLIEYRSELLKAEEKKQQAL